MDRVKRLSPGQCILFAVALASASDIASLHRLTPLRPDVFELELIFRILLTYLPESLEPVIYTTYVEEVGTRLYLQQHDGAIAQVEEYLELVQDEVRIRMKNLHLLPLRHPSIPIEATKDALDLFLIHRSYQIDKETGLLSLVPQLLAPFLERSELLKDWYVGHFLPLHRLEYEYYPQEEPKMSLERFETLRGEEGINTLLSRAKDAASRGTATSDTVGRDFRGVLGPWIHGSNSNKRRKLGNANRLAQIPTQDMPKLHFKERTTDLDNGPSIESWRQSFQWIVKESVKNFPLVVQIIDGWSGPRDVDLGGIVDEKQFYRKDKELTEDLTYQYCQAAFAAIYATELDRPETLDGAHAIMVRLAELCNFEPPPDLATSIKLLPIIQRSTRGPEESSAASIQMEELLQADQPLTAPNLETFSLLQMLVYSAYQFKGLGFPLSVARVSKYRFWSDETEQIKLVDDVLRVLTSNTSKSVEQWSYDRDVLLWLWNWGLEEEADGERDGHGVLGKIPYDDLDLRILKALCTARQFALIKKLYLDPKKGSSRPLSSKQLEDTGLELAFQHYDNASNGNKNRGEVKKAYEVLDLFRSGLPDSVPFRRMAALLSATHALSFYSLALHRGQPFRPIDIHNTDEPISLLEKVLEQNHGSYTKLDDLIEIGRNLTLATPLLHPFQRDENGLKSEDQDLELRVGERQVVGMAIDSALAADDFETAYSYVVNHLRTPIDDGESNDGLDSGTRPGANVDDYSWRAAFQAGRHRKIAASQASHTPQVRRLEQRMELLSQALLLAPPAALSEVLAAWRRCEEELLAVLGQEHADEQDFNDNAARGDVRMPGGYLGTETFTIQPKRKEMGRGATEESPMGLFDVARGAAAAIGRTAGASLNKARENIAAGAIAERATPLRTSEDSSREAASAEARVRKRDMVANGLVSGIGWVLGAAPVQEQQHR